MNTNMSSQKMEIQKRKRVEHKDEIRKDTKECALSPAGPNENSSRASKHCCVSMKTTWASETWRAEATGASQA